MKLREDEKVLRIYHHHPTPFVLNIFKAVAYSLPILFVIYLINIVLSTGWNIILYLVFSFVFILIVIYLSLIYWLDKLIITDKRIIHQNWKTLTVMEESQVDLSEIQDIQTHEKGFLSYFRFFDYGQFKLATASSYVALVFADAPNPEEIRRFVQHVKQQ